MWKSFQVYIHVHTVETGYQRRYHQGNGKACHAFHDSIHVVGNNGSESVHCPCKDVAVDVYRVVRLFQFDNNILQQFQIKIVRVLEDVFQPSYHDFVAADGSIEVHQRFLQFHQLEKVFVADALFQFLFGGGHIVIDLFQIFQEPYGGGVYDS